MQRICSLRKGFFSLMAICQSDTIFECKIDIQSKTANKVMKEVECVTSGKDEQRRPKKTGETVRNDKEVCIGQSHSCSESMIEKTMSRDSLSSRRVLKATQEESKKNFLMSSMTFRKCKKISWLICTLKIFSLTHLSRMQHNSKLNSMSQHA